MGHDVERALVVLRVQENAAFMPVDQSGVGTAPHVQRGSGNHLNGVVQPVPVHGKHGSGGDIHAAQAGPRAEGVVHVQRQFACIHPYHAAGGNRIGPFDNQFPAAGFNQAQPGKIGGGRGPVFVGRVLVGELLVEIEHGIFPDVQLQGTSRAGLADDGIKILSVGRTPGKCLVGSQFNHGGGAPAGNINAPAARASGLIPLGNNDAAGGAGGEFKSVKIILQTSQRSGIVPELVQLKRTAV